MCSIMGVARCLDKLKQARYHNYNLSTQETEGVADLWMEILIDVDDQTLMAATLLWISEDHAFGPSVGEVRGAAVRLMVKSSGIPDPYQAYEEVVKKPTKGEKIGGLQVLGDGTWGYPRKPVEFSSPVVEAVAYMMGWPDKFPTDNPVADRAQFSKAYEQESRRSIENATCHPVIRDHVDSRKSLTSPVSLALGAPARIVSDTAKKLGAPK